MKEQIKPIYLCLDTNQYIKCCYNFKKGKLNILKQYCNKGFIKLILPNVIIEEVKKNMKEDIEIFIEKYKKLNKEMVLSSFKDNEIYQDMNKRIIDKEMYEYLEKSFEEYINDQNVEVLVTDGINIDEILNDYFLLNPPFTIKKRNEFKDSIIIKTIIKYQKDKNIDISVVSSDNGFCEALKNNSRIKIYNEVSEVIADINKSFKRNNYKTIELYIKQEIITKDIKNELLEFLEDRIIILTDNKYGMYDGSSIDSIFSNISMRIDFIEESMEEISANMRIACLIDLKYDIKESSTYENTEYGEMLDYDIIKEDRHRYEFDVSIIFKVSDENGGLYIDKYIFKNEDVIYLDNSTLINSNINFYHREDDDESYFILEE